jgi:hypothetical protein
MIDYRLLPQTQSFLRIAEEMSNHLLHHQLQEVGRKPLYGFQESSSFAELPREKKKNLGLLGFYHLLLRLMFLFPQKQFLAATRFKTP